MQRLTAAIILGLASLFFAVNPAVAQNDAKVTARDVVDRESLKAFVLEAREYLDSFETLSGYRRLGELQGRYGEWRLRRVSRDDPAFRKAVRSTRHGSR